MTRWLLSRLPRAVVMGVLGVACTAPAWAFEPGPPRVSREAAEARGGGAPPAEAAPLQLPPVQAPSPTEGVASGLKIFVKEYRLTGNTAISAEELATVTAPYTNREVTNEDLAALRQALTLYYVQHGYLNSGATIPDQQVADGVVQIAITEGRLTDIAVTGNRRLREGYLKDRLARGAGPPLNVNDLQAQMQLLLSGPFVKRINGELAPGEHPGEAVLKAQVEENLPYMLQLGMDNDLAPSLGEFRGVLRGALYSPSGFGDIVSTELAYADGSKEASLFYSVPVNPYGTTLDVYGEYSDGDVVEERLDPLNIEGETTTFGARIAHALIETPHQRLGVAVSFDARHSTTKLLGTGFAFSPGVEPDGDSSVSVLRFMQDWTRRSPLQVIALRSTVSVGLNVLGATHNPTTDVFGNVQPDGRFVAWLGQAQWARRLPWYDTQLVFRLDGQYSGDPLLPLEQFAVGGGRTVRGYAKNLLVRDDGFATSLELRVPVWKTKGGQTLLEFAPFVDAGGAWFDDDTRPTPGPSIIPAVGFGFRSDPHPRIHAEIYWGYALEDVPDAGSSPQEDGIYFTLTADIFR